MANREVQKALESHFEMSKNFEKTILEAMWLMNENGKQLEVGKPIIFQIIVQMKGDERQN